MATENEGKLSTKNETDIENVETGLSRMTDEDIQNIFDHALKIFKDPSLIRTM